MTYKCKVWLYFLFILLLYPVRSKGVRYVCGTNTKCLPTEECLKKHDGVIKVTVYHCEGSQKICCPMVIKKTEVDQRANELPRPSNKTSNPKIRNHKNYGLLPKSCGKNKMETHVLRNKIRGGDDARNGEFPWMALILIPGKEGKLGRCGGTLISQMYVITAAHCLRNHNSSRELIITLGIIDRACAETFNENINASIIVNYEEAVFNLQSCAFAQQRTSQMIFSHQKFVSYDTGYDIALIRLNKAIEINKYVHPACLPQVDVKGLLHNVKNKSVMFSGWGISDVETNILQKLTLTNVYNKEQCNSFIEGRVTYRQARWSFRHSEGDYSKRTDEGDSGGSLVLINKKAHRSIVIGVLSYGVKDYRKFHSFTVYTKVFKFMEWILDLLQP